MRNEFCTLFDVNYLPRALALYRSLEDVTDDFMLRAFCMDARSKELLERLELPRLAAVSLDELEAADPDLLAVKSTRTQIEYCWTATPAICLFALEQAPDLAGITYVDADLMFFSDPAPLYDEMGDDSVMIVPHRYAPRWKEWERTSGIYNVEWLTFRSDERGLAALRWWRERCIEWCFFRFEDGKMGDQKYLDDWPERFAGVHVLQHPGGGLAPWNIEQFEVSDEGGRVHVDGRPLVFFHYHSLRLYRGLARLRRLGLWARRYELSRGPIRLVWSHGYPLTARVRELVWEPYLRRLGEAVQEIRRVERGFDAGFSSDDRALLRAAGRRVLRAPRRAFAGARRRVRERGEIALRRHRESWKAASVADQMLALARRQLSEPDDVPPFRAFVQIMRDLERRPELPRPARLVDIGCGVGHYGEVLDRHFGGTFAYTGVDYAEPMIEAARREWPDRDFVVADVLDEGFDFDQYDIVVAGALVDVLADYEHALARLLAARAPYVVLHRQRVTEGRSRVDVAGAYDGQRTYRTYLNRSDLARLAARHGRDIVLTVPVEGDMESFVLARDPR